VYSLTYSPSGDRIASGGNNVSICIWNSKAGELLVSEPIEQRPDVFGVPKVRYMVEVWTTTNSASDKFARILDNVSGTELRARPLVVYYRTFTQK
jgi:hypothetical protein